MGDGPGVSRVCRRVSGSSEPERKGQMTDIHTAKKGGERKIMSDTNKSPTEKVETQKSFTDKVKEKFQHWGVIAGAVLVAFLIGLVPMWLTARSNAAERDAALTELRRSEISNLLSSSIVEARRGEYESARQGTSEFFTRLRAEDEKGDEGFLNADQRAKIKTIFADRDTAITMLAQRDPASLDRLTGFYDLFLETVPTAQNVSRP